MPKVVEAILNLPENAHTAVRYTSIMLIGELSEWINCHPASLQAILNFLLFSLQQKNGTASAAATALTSICTACRDHMICHLNGMIEIARSLDSFEICNDDAISLLKGIAIIISRLSKEDIQSSVQQISAFQLEPLQALIDADVRIEPNTRSDPVFWIDRLAALLRHIVPDLRATDIHPCVPVLSQFWLVMSAILNKYQKNVRIMERSCRCIRYTLRCVGKQAAVLLEPLVVQIVQLYDCHQHSCFLYLGSILVDEFCDVSAECTQGLLDMLQAFIQPTFTLLQRENGLKKYPDTVDDFFRLCSRFIQRCPLQFLQSAIVSPVIQCALLACTLDHRDANLSVMKFFFNLLNCGRSERDEMKRMLVKQLVYANGEALIMNLVHASVFYLHSYMLSDVADVIVELKSIDSEQVNVNLRKALDVLPKNNTGGSVTATDKQLDTFYLAIVK